MERHTWKTSSSWTRQQSGSSKLCRDKPADEKSFMVLWILLVLIHTTQSPQWQKVQAFLSQLSVNAWNTPIEIHFQFSYFPTKLQSSHWNRCPAERTTLVLEENSMIPTVTGSTVVVIKFSQSVAALEPQYCIYWCDIRSIICVLWFITTNLFQPLGNKIEMSPTIT